MSPSELLAASLNILIFIILHSYIYYKYKSMNIIKKFKKQSLLFFCISTVSLCFYTKINFMLFMIIQAIIITYFAIQFYQKLKVND